MGDFDFVKVVLDRIGDMRWMQIAIKPAKPFAFGTVTRSDGAAVPVFGLPGNPVSSMVSFELFCRPGLRRMAGHAEDRLDRPMVVAMADEATASTSRRQDPLRPGRLPTTSRPRPATGSGRPAPRDRTT